MTSPSRDPSPTASLRAATLFTTALSLGGLGDLLFHGAGWGLNVPLWIGALVGASWWLYRRPIAHAAWPLALVFFFAVCSAWRASGFLRFWNVVAMLAAAVAATVQLRHPIGEARLRHYLRGAGALALNLSVGPVLAAAHLELPWGRQSRLVRNVRALGVGAVMGVPVVLVFGGLLASADPVMGAFAARLFSWDIGALVDRLWIVVLFGWLAAGLLDGTGDVRFWSGHSPLPQPRRRLGMLELGVPLGALLVMLVSFLGLQARYVFGGESLIQLTGLTYAELARRGFFELVTVSALVVPVLLLGQHLLDRSSRAAVESFRALVLVVLAVVLLVMVSALARMHLYVQSYGLTEDRLYASSFMGWIGFVLVWLAVTELRGRLSRFATGAVLAGLGVVAALNVANPDGLIARTNITRADRGLRFDVHYLNRLSTDAVPAVAARWESLDARTRSILRAGLMARSSRAADWRATTWSRLQADRAIRDLKPETRRAQRRPVLLRGIEPAKRDQRPG